MSADEHSLISDDYIALRREVAALKVALRDKEAANTALRLEVNELRFKVAQSAQRIHQIVKEVLL